MSDDATFVGLVSLTYLSGERYIALLCDLWLALIDSINRKNKLLIQGLLRIV